MKIALHQLEQHAARQLASLYLIAGDEILLLQEAVALLRVTAQANGFSERVKIAADAKNDWGNMLHTESQSLSLFAEKRVIELDLRGVKLNAANSELLQRYAENPPSENLLIVYCHKLDAKAETTKWYKAIQKTGVVVPIWPITREQLPQWILQRAKKFQVNLTSGAASRLADHVEGNLLAAAQEIEKLGLLHPNDVVNEDALLGLIGNHANFDIFNLVESVLLGNQPRALKILQNLLATNTEPALILWALTRELNTMAEFADLLQKGGTLSNLFNQFRIWEKRQPQVRAFLQRCTLSHCWDLMLHAAQIDRMIKGAETGNVRDELERFVLSV